MARYFLYCEKHGKIGRYYSDPDEASKGRKKYKRNSPGPHGKVEVIEEYSISKYGHVLVSLRKYRK